jgi:serine/threonine protein kinase
MLEFEWCKLNEVHQHVSPGWVTEAKVAGVVVPVVAVPWYENGDVLTYLQSAQDVCPVDFACQIASGLGHLHTMGVVHGNVHPVNDVNHYIYMPLPYLPISQGNVMITQARKACLVDVGMRALVNHCFHSDNIPLSAHWCYKAPEELAEGKSYTKAADVYGFAGTVYAVCSCLVHGLFSV